MNWAGNVLHERNGILVLSLLLLVGTGLAAILFHREQNSSGSADPEQITDLPQIVSEDFSSRTFELFQEQLCHFAVEESGNVPIRDWVENAAVTIRGLRTYLSDADLYDPEQDSSGTVRIVVLTDQEAYKKYLSRQGIGPHQDSHFEPERQLIILYYTPEEPLRRLLHEAVHLFMERSIGDYRDLPVWLLEGLAMILETGSVAEDGQFRSEPLNRKRLQEWRKYRKGGRMLPLRKLIDMRYADLFAKLKEAGDREKRRTVGAGVYAQSWGLMHYLKENYGFREVCSFYRAVRNEPDQQKKLFRTHFDDVRSVESELVEFIQSIEGD